MAMAMCPALLMGLAALLSVSPPGPRQTRPADDSTRARARAAERPGDDERDVPVFRAGVSTVLVDTLVLDSDGNPVSDLTRDDFEVLENGVVQDVTSFDVTDWTSYVEALGSEPEPDVDVAINQYPRRFLFVLNRQGAEFGFLARAKRALSSFVVESLADGDEAMVIDIGYATKIIQEFQPEKESTLEAIRTLSQMQMDYPLDPYRASQQIYEDLASIAGSLALLPGRKIVILVSPELATFAPLGSSAADQGLVMKETIDALNQANASVYSIDLYGAHGGRRTVYGGLSPLASETGGRYFKNAVSFEPILRRIGRENQRYYLLGYSPQTPPDGAYRKIEVRVWRQDVDVIARSGYYASLPAEATAEAGSTGHEEGDEAEPDVDVDANVDAAGGAAPDYPLAVELTTYLLPTGAGTVRVAMSVALPEQLLEGPRGASRLELAIARDGGEPERRFEEVVSSERYYFVRSTDLAPGPYLISLRLSADNRDVYRSSMGLRIPEDFGERFGLSSIIPVVSPDGIPSVGTGELPIRPTPVTPRGEDTFLLFQVFRGSEAPSERVRVTFTVYDDRNRNVRSGGPNEPIALGPNPGGTPVLLSVPTRALDYGTYRIEIRVQDLQRDRRAAGEIQIRVR